MLEHDAHHCHQRVRLELGEGSRVVVQNPCPATTTTTPVVVTRKTRGRKGRQEPTGRPHDGSPIVHHHAGGGTGRDGGGGTMNHLISYQKDMAGTYMHELSLFRRLRLRVLCVKKSRYTSGRIRRQGTPDLHHHTTTKFNPNLIITSS